MNLNEVQAWAGFSIPGNSGSNNFDMKAEDVQGFLADKVGFLAKYFRMGPLEVEYWIHHFSESGNGSRCVASTKAGHQCRKRCRRNGSMGSYTKGVHDRCEVHQETGDRAMPAKRLCISDD